VREETYSRARSGSGSGGRSSGFGGDGGGVAGSANGEINARLVSLIDGPGVPPPLDDTVTSCSALTAKGAGDGDVE